MEIQSTLNQFFRAEQLDQEIQSLLTQSLKMLRIILLLVILPMILGFLFSRLSQPVLLGWIFSPCHSSFHRHDIVARSNLKGVSPNTFRKNSGSCRPSSTPKRCPSCVKDQGSAPNLLLIRKSLTLWTTQICN